MSKLSTAHQCFIKKFDKSDVIHYLLSLLTLLASASAWARIPAMSEDFEGGKLKKVYDFNKDGKADYTEAWQDKTLVEKKEDMDYDGTYDVMTVFNPDPEAEYFKVIEQRRYGRNLKRKISYWNDYETNKTFSLTQIDDDDDGTWDREYKISSSIRQNIMCTEEVHPELNLLQSIVQATQADDFIETKWGHLIHKSCLDGASDWFLQSAEKAVVDGVSCLKRLGNAGGSGAQKNAAGLENLLENKNVKIICNESGYKWLGGEIAHATTEKGTKAKDTRVSHPAVSLNPSVLAKYKSEGKAGTLNLIRTIFHEQIHNLGYRHNHDIEYSYSCEKCCFPSSNGEAEIACKVCSGNYNGPTDLAYMKDMSDYGQAYFSAGSSLPVIQKYLKENPGDMEGMSYLALGLSGFYDPIGSKLGEKLKASHTLSKSQQQTAAKAMRDKNSKLFKTYDASAGIIADAYYETYVKRDPRSALALIKSKINVLKSQMDLKDQKDGDLYVRHGLRISLARLIDDVWIHGYAGKETDPDVKKQMKLLSSELAGELGI